MATPPEPIIIGSSPVSFTACRSHQYRYQGDAQQADYLDIKSGLHHNYPRYFGLLYAARFGLKQELTEFKN